jgi:hypothetical protein
MYWHYARASKASIAPLNSLQIVPGGCTILVLIRHLAGETGLLGQSRWVANGGEHTFAGSGANRRSKASDRLLDIPFRQHCNAVGRRRTAMRLA